jgi:hypothetical protein
MPKRPELVIKSENKVLHRLTQAERARALAAQSSSSLVADLLEAHAQLCERNAASMASKGPSPSEMRKPRLVGQRLP